MLGKTEDYVNYPDAKFVIAIGNGAVRQKVAERLQGVRWYTAIHPKAVVSAMDTAIGEGTVVMAGAVINPCAVIGKHCIINTGAGVDHDDRIGDYTHIAVGATLAGTVTVGSTVWIGAGAVVSNNISICDGCMIGAGAVVVRNIEETGTYVGVPARKIK